MEIGRVCMGLRKAVMAAAIVAPGFAPAARAVEANGMPHLAKRHRATLAPWLKKAWESHGAKTGAS